MRTDDLEKTENAHDVDRIAGEANKMLRTRLEKTTFVEVEAVINSNT